jgi:hypothetical protein
MIESSSTTQVATNQETNQLEVLEALQQCTRLIKKLEQGNGILKKQVTAESCNFCKIIVSLMEFLAAAGRLGF